MILSHTAKDYSNRAKEIWRVTYPVVIEQLFITLMGIVNTAMISSVSTDAMSAAGHINNASNIIISLFAALTTGGTIVVAQAIGANDKQRATVVGAQAIMSAAFFSIVVSALLAVFQYPIINALFGGSVLTMKDAGQTYFMYVNLSFPLLAVTQTIFGVLRGSGDTSTPMKITLLMNVVNFLLGYALILGVSFGPIQTPSFGVHGAGIALSAARLAGLIYAAYIIFFTSKTIKLNRLANFKFNGAAQKAVFKLGLPTSADSTMFNAGRMLTQLYIVGMGSAAMAANTVANSIFVFISVPGNALMISVMILIGQRVGRGQIDDIKKTAVFSTVLGMIVIGLICLASLPLMNMTIRLYNLNSEEAPLYLNLMYTAFIATALVWPASFVTPSALRATGDVKYTMVISILSMWLFRITTGYLLGVVFGLGVIGVWCGMYTDWAVRAVFYHYRILNGKWKKYLKG
ncbi:MAG: MATE family efflux transporter [Defluviitaleaceae bacterium]|nr:MATE family efflux transporter [Defluviitaleaceae bacterium]